MIFQALPFLLASFSIYLFFKPIAIPILSIVLSFRELMFQVEFTAEISISLSSQSSSISLLLLIIGSLFLPLILYWLFTLCLGLVEAETFMIVVNQPKLLSC